MFEQVCSSIVEQHLFLVKYTMAKVPFQFASIYCQIFFYDDSILAQLHWFTPMFQTKMPKVQRGAVDKDAIHAWLKVYAQSNSQQERLL
jgi:hypothetical protein